MMCLNVCDYERVVRGEKDQVMCSFSSSSVPGRSKEGLSTSPSVIEAKMMVAQGFLCAEHRAGDK